MTGIQKISSIVLTIRAGVSVIFAGLYFFGGSVPETVGTTLEEKNYTELILIWGVILFIIAALSTLAFSLVNVITNPKALRGFMVGLLVFAVLLGISYLLASSDPINMETVRDLDPSARTMKWVGTGLNATYILAIVAFIGIIASEVVRAFK